MAKPSYIPIHKQVAEHEGAIAMDELAHGINSSKSLLKLLPPTAWQRAALAFAAAAFLIFILNLSFILLVTVNRRHTLEGGIGIISEQGCSQTKQLNTGIHLVINIMSTVLLAGSNYCMQCVVAPSRTEVDVAHAKEKWFDIGVQISETHTSEDWLVDFKAKPGSWTPFQSAVTERYSQRNDEHCKLKFSNLLCWIVVAVNLLKVALTLLVAFGRGESPLLTVGDAVASFLEHGDETTRGMCLKTKQDFYIGDWSKESREFDPTPTKAIMSFIYLNYNSLYTNITNVTEWDRFSHHRKGLRVSSPSQGAQRNTYFLQLPYRCSLPIITLSGVIHSLILQSIFLVNLEIYGPPDSDLMNFIPAEYTYRRPNGGQSADKTWLGGGVGRELEGEWCRLHGMLLVAKRNHSRDRRKPLHDRLHPRRLRFGSAPVAGSCSAAISAACHPCEAEENAWEEPLQWGVVAAPGDGPGRCAFSSASVGVPSRGQLYA
ncbi:hypothetical protein CSOJ01_14451 [Colletotrichum sojae]|uniref:DUF6536 domain-containing protein n=1 Tax=Colletotrichum sojae TaxID=2175907 RepID=A0A8H6IPU2_9PEZI|nr:hypothetical protein CSOJ01_14451 [Colletotrichum sojae]